MKWCAKKYALCLDRKKCRILTKGKRVKTKTYEILIKGFNEVNAESTQ